MSSLLYLFNFHWWFNFQLTTFLDGKKVEVKLARPKVAYTPKRGGQSMSRGVEPQYPGSSGSYQTYGSSVYGAPGTAYVDYRRGSYNALVGVVSGAPTGFWSNQGFSGSAPLTGSGFGYGYGTTYVDYRHGSYNALVWVVSGASTGFWSNQGFSGSAPLTDSGSGYGTAYVDYHHGSYNALVGVVSGAPTGFGATKESVEVHH